MPASAAPPAPHAATQPQQWLLFERSLEALRALQTEMMLGSALAASGLLLVAVGVVWGVCAIVQAHPYLLCIMSGCALLFASLLMRPDGLITVLPSGVQDLLLNRTIFDFLYDDTGMQNFVRVWGRYLALASLGGLTPGDIRVLTAGIDHDFTDAVFRRTFLWWLPPPVRAVLMPSAAQQAQRPSQEVARLLQAANAGVGSIGLPASLGGPELTPQRIAVLLKEKEQARSIAITQPDLVAAVTNVLGLRAVALRVGDSFLQQAHGLLTAAFACCSVSAAVLGVPSVREFFLRGVARGLALCSAKVPWVGDSRASLVAARVARTLAVLGALSAGATLAVAAASKRVAAMREDLSTPTPPDAASAAETPEAASSLEAGDGRDSRHFADGVSPASESTTASEDQPSASTSGAPLAAGLPGAADTEARDDPLPAGLRRRPVPSAGASPAAPRGSAGSSSALSCD